VSLLQTNCVGTLKARFLFFFEPMRRPCSPPGGFEKTAYLLELFCITAGGI